MKKYLYKYLAFVLSLIFAFPTVYASRPMNAFEYERFESKITKIIENFYETNRASLESMTPEQLRDLEDSFSKSNDEFDIAHSLDEGNSGTFLTALKSCHKHVSDLAKFPKQPLCCRGLSMFVLQELRIRDINCKYIHFFERNPLIESSFDAHDVVAYQKSNGKWYVCDMSNALSSYIILRRFGKFALYTVYAKFGITEIKDLLSMPLPQYKEYFAYKSPAEIVNLSCAGIAKTSWHEFELTPEFLHQPASAAFSHYQPLPPDELEEYYGVRTLKEAQRLIKGKTKAELSEFMRARLPAGTSITHI